MSDNDWLLSEVEQRTLLAAARRSADYAMAGLSSYQPVVDCYPISLRRAQSSFAIVYNGGRPLGCAGTIRSSVPLLSDVCHNVHEATSHAALLEELDEPRLAVWLVSPLEELSTCSLEQVLAQLEPGIHGVWLQYQDRDATLTPDKWAAFPDKRDFLRQLRIRADLPADAWPVGMHLARYAIQKLPVISIGNHRGARRSLH